MLWRKRLAEELLCSGCGATSARSERRSLIRTVSVGHCGLIMAIDKGPMRSFEFLPKEYIGYAARTHIVQDVSGVSKDCMMVRRELFLAAGGFDETYDVCFYDADFCLKVLRDGYRVVLTPYLEMNYQERAGACVRDSEMLGYERDLLEFRLRWRDFLEKGTLTTIRIWGFGRDCIA